VKIIDKKVNASGIHPPHKPIQPIPIKRNSLLSYSKYRKIILIPTNITIITKIKLKIPCKNSIKLSPGINHSLIYLDLNVKILNN
jgi:hypothetical protein